MPGKVKKSIFRVVTEWLHRWLGLASGIIVFIVCLTGALWVFRYEVYYFTEPWQRVAVTGRQFLLPAVIRDSAMAYLHTKGDTAAELITINYGSPGKAVVAGFETGKTGSAEIYINPYTGAILKDKREATATDNFFLFVRAGHRFLWLPQKIGSPVVGSACIVFLLIMITGLVWWYPQKWNRANRRKSFTVKWKAKWKRLNIDLHNVVGFYAMIFLILLTISGVVFTFDWFSNGVYRALTFQAPPSETYAKPVSDTTDHTGNSLAFALDSIYRTTVRKHPVFGRIILVTPEKASDTYQAIVFFGDGTLIYNKAQYYFDRVSLLPVPSADPEDKPFAQVSTGKKAFRMNFDVHTGQIAGLPTKIIAFLACLVGASLPVTGCMIWWNKRRKKPALTS